MTNLEGRVILRRPALVAPRGVRSDIDVLCDLAARLGCREGFAFVGPRAVFDELRSATAGAKADYSGITYARIAAEDGVFWPCPSEDHPGTPRLFSEAFAHADGFARFIPVEHRAAGEEPDDEYPLFLTTGRYREHYNSGAQTRGVPSLIAAQPEPRLHLHPHLARELGLSSEEWVFVESRRGSLVLRSRIDPDIRPDTVFAPFHWGGDQSANIVTNPALDPISRMPEFKICAVRVRVADGWQVPNDGP